MDRPLKILHLEDNSTDAFLIKRALTKSEIEFTIKVVDTREDFISELDLLQPDVILSDHALPQFDSLEALKIYKEKGYDIPFILITGSVSEEFASTSIKQGADDYILKNNLIRLPSAIQQALKARKAAHEREEANLQAEISSKELNTFIYKAAHELRGPLCSIMGLTNVAGLENDRKALPDYIQKISESTKKLDAVLLALIEVMTIKDTKPEIKEIDLKSVIDNIIKRFRFLEDTTTIDFGVKIANHKGFFSDENILSSILLNIIENAIKYRNVSRTDSFVNITVTCVETGINIDIEDNGMGIEAEILDQIFEMYYRGNQISKGSGLGLYIAKNGVKKLGGTIDVKSELHKGSTFTVFLPTFMVLM